ncbi:hypothetical protein HIDPHFAB_00921 [Nocardioides sp. T2.26MG-1]|nr:hypothetical protein HIDPHFAB_00921 [Nocardioides sp. T2.26MG-1]
MGKYFDANVVHGMVTRRPPERFVDIALEAGFPEVIHRC